MGRAQLFEKLINVVGDVAVPALTSGAFTGMLGLMGGMSPKEAALYAGADTLASAASIGLVRKLRPKTPVEIRNALTGELLRKEPGRSKLELPANIAASLLTGAAVSNLLGPGQAEQIAQQTATGVEQALNASYNQTEVYFVQHSDNLMPRVHQMRTDLAQYYHSKKPSIRLQYITSNDEKVNFQMNGTDLLLRDLNIFCTTKTNTRNIMEQLKQLAVQNNATGASIYDLGNIIKAESIEIGRAHV